MRVALQALEMVGRGEVCGLFKWLQKRKQMKSQFSEGAGLDKTWAPVKLNGTFYSDLHVKRVFKQQQQQQANSN